MVDPRGNGYAVTERSSILWVFSVFIQCGGNDAFTGFCRAGCGLSVNVYSNTSVYLWLHMYIYIFSSYIYMRVSILFRWYSEIILGSFVFVRLQNKVVWGYVRRSRFYFILEWRMAWNSSKGCCIWTSGTGEQNTLDELCWLAGFLGMSYPPLRGLCVCLFASLIQLWSPIVSTLNRLIFMNALWTRYLYGPQTLVIFIFVASAISVWRLYEGVRGKNTWAIHCTVWKFYVVIKIWKVWKFNFCVAAMLGILVLRRKLKDFFTCNVQKHIFLLRVVWKSTFSSAV